MTAIDVRVEPEERVDFGQIRLRILHCDGGRQQQIEVYDNAKTEWQLVPGVEGQLVCWNAGETAVDMKIEVPVKWLKCHFEDGTSTTTLASKKRKLLNISLVPAELPGKVPQQASVTSIMLQIVPHDDLTVVKDVKKIGFHMEMHRSVETNVDAESPQGEIPPPDISVTIEKASDNAVAALPDPNPALSIGMKSPSSSPARFAECVEEEIPETSLTLERQTKAKMVWKDVGICLAITIFLTGFYFVRIGFSNYAHSEPAKQVPIVVHLPTYNQICRDEPGFCSDAGNAEYKAILIEGAHVYVSGPHPTAVLGKEYSGDIPIDAQNMYGVTHVRLCVQNASLHKEWECDLDSKTGLPKNKPDLQEGYCH